MVNNSKQQKVGAQIGARAQSTLEAQATGVRAALVQWGLSFLIKSTERRYHRV